MNVSFRYKARSVVIKICYIPLVALIMSSKSFASVDTVSSVQEEPFSFSSDNQTLLLTSTGSITTYTRIVEGRIARVVDGRPAVTSSGVLNNLEIEVNTTADGIYSGIYAREASAIHMGHISGDFTLNLNSGSITGHEDSISGVDGFIEVYGTAISLNYERGANSDLDAYITTQAGTSINGDIELGNNVNATINNAGTINGDIGVNVTQVINNSGTINGEILLGYGDNSSITNTGTIVGDVKMSSSPDAVFNIDGGSVTGDISSYSASQEINLDSASIVGDVHFSSRLNFLSSTNNITGDVSTHSGSAVLDLNNESNTITGGLTMSNGDNISIDIANGAVGSIAATQAAMIASGVTLDISVNRGNYLADGSQYVIVDGGDGSVVNKIKDSNIDVNNTNTNTAFTVLRFSTSVSALGDDLMLDVTRAAANEVTNNGNAQGAYNAINNIGADASGLLQELQNFLDNSDNQHEIQQALASLTPQDETSTKLSTIAAVNGSVSTTENRMDSFHISSLKSSDSFQSVNSNQGKLGISSGDEISTIELWGQTFGTKAKQKDINDDGYNSSSFGLAFGIDKEIDKDTRIGVALSYADSQVESKDKVKNTQIDSYQINLYAGKSLGKYFVDGILGFTWNEYNSTRYISSVGSVANADYQGQNYIAKLRAGSVYGNFMGSDFNLIPEISTTFVNSFVDSYEEQGADTLNLNVSGGYDEFLEGRIGISIEHNPIIIRSLATTPRLSVSYGYNFLNQNQTTISNFVGQSATFNTVSSSVDPSSIRWGAGFDVQNNDFVTTSLDYNNERRGNYVSHSAIFKIKYQF